MAFENLKTDKLALEIVDLANEWYEYRRHNRDQKWISCYYHYLSEYNPSLIWTKGEGVGGRSKVFIGMTRRKIMTVYNKVVTSLFGGAQLPFTVDPSPYRENIPGLDERIMRQRSDKMLKKIQDQQIATNWGLKSRLHFLISCIFGSSVIKFPVIKQNTVFKYSFAQAQQMMGIPGMEGMQGMMEPDLVESIETYPDMEVVSVFDFAFDPNCDTMAPNPLQTGRGCVQFKIMDNMELSRLAWNPSYDVELINKIVKESIKSKSRGAREDSTKSQIKYALGEGQYSGDVGHKIIEFHGSMPARDIRKHITGSTPLDDRYKDYDFVECCITLIEPDGTEIVKKIRCIENPRRPQTRPFMMLPYEHQVYSAWSRGIAENILHEQGVLNSAVRLFIDTKAITAIPPFVYDRKRMPPGQTFKDLVLYPGMGIGVDGNVESFIKMLEFPDVSQRLGDLIGLMERYGDESSGISKTAQGMQTIPKQETASGMAMLLEMAQEPVGGFVDNIDKYFIEPWVTAIYHYNMQFDEDPEIKGDYEVKAGGARALAMKQQYWQKLLMFLNSVGKMLPPEMVMFILDELRRSVGIEGLDDFYDRMVEHVRQIQSGGAGGGAGGPGPGMAAGGQVLPGQVRQGANLRPVPAGNAQR